jgi:hypothetical protein
MAIVLVTTAIDPSRVGLTYKIEMPEYALETWWEGNLQAKNAVGEVFTTGKVKGANTAVTIVHEGDGRVESWAINFTWSQLQALLAKADRDYNENTGLPGRPEKRVLVASTSKERRTGALAGKQVSY